MRGLVVDFVFEVVWFCCFYGIIFLFIYLGFRVKICFFWILYDLVLFCLFVFFVFYQFQSQFLYYLVVSWLSFFQCIVDIGGFLIVFFEQRILRVQFFEVQKGFFMFMKCIMVEGFGVVYSFYLLDNIFNCYFVNIWILQRFLCNGFYLGTGIQQ